MFSRVGASDDIAGGRSTFMVEMVETAAILNRATARSLVILDEIGRGTATFDGLSIAWAAVEALHDDTGCRALFATHFHEMTALAKTPEPRLQRHHEGARMGGRGGVPARGRPTAPPTAPTASRWRGSPACPNRCWRGRGRCWRVLEQRSSGVAGGAVLDDLPLFAHQPPPPKAGS